MQPGKRKAMANDQPQPDKDKKHRTGWKERAVALMAAFENGDYRRVTWLIGKLLVSIQNLFYICCFVAVGCGILTVSFDICAQS